MPQMSPMNWFLLMFYFMLIYLSLMILIYYFINLSFSIKLMNNKSKLNFLVKWY